MNAALRNAIQNAASLLNPRAQYARDVLFGHHRWSGADLRGKAASFGAKYAQQRRNAEAALRKAGGVVIQVNRGLRVTAVPIGQDDFGAALFATTAGVAIAGRKSCRLV